MRDTTGAIILARSIIESDIFFNKPDKWFKIWCFILLIANHKDFKRFKRGECFTTYDEICSYTKATRNEVDHCMRWLKQATQITTRKATRGFYINIVNYNIYQKLSHYKSDTESDIKSELKAIQKRQTGDTINKNDKKEKNDIEGEVITSPTPKENAKLFFKGVTDFLQKIDSPESKLMGEVLKNVSTDYGVDSIEKKKAFWNEIVAFGNFWQERDLATGKKEKWEMQKTFEVQRRLQTWFRNKINWAVKSAGQTNNKGRGFA